MPDTERLMSKEPEEKGPGCGYGFLLAAGLSSVFWLLVIVGVMVVKWLF